MCGIIAIYSKKQHPIEKKHLLRNLLEHRGMDDYGSFSSDTVFLGAARHAVIDPENGNQPIFDTSSRFVLIGNGEIYNYRELNTFSLSTPIHHDLTIANEAFKKHGISAINDLRGPFALVIWDTKKQELWIARDRLGERTLYVYEDDEFYVFASEIQIIRQHLNGLGRSLSLCESSIADLISFGFKPDAKTPYQEIREIVPGTLTQISKTGIHSEQFKIQEVEVPHQNEVQSNIKFLLTRAFDRVLVSDVPVSLAFSGGIDSTMILDHTIRRGIELSSIITLYDHRSQQQDQNLKRSRDIADFLGIEIDAIPFEVPSVESVIPIIQKCFDLPVSEPIAIHNHFLHKHASRKSKVILGGHGSDEIFGGYERYEKIRLSSLMNESSVSLETLLEKKKETDWKRLMRCNHSLIAQSKDMPADKRERLQHIFDFCQADNYISFSQSLDLLLFQYYDNFRMPDENGIYNGVEVRSPYFDYDLVKYLLPLPRNRWPDSLVHKPFLTNCINNKQLLPFLKKGKIGFDDHFKYSDWIYKNRARIREVILFGRLPKMNICKDGLLNDLKNSDHLFRSNPKLAWRLFTMTLWLDKEY